MHYKVFSEAMTIMFHQCGYFLMDCNIFEIQKSELFLRALHHHLVMGTVNMTQVGHFLILMTYMSFCRLNHYTDYLSDREGAMIEPALWMCLVIISFRSTFQMKGAHRTINPYFKGTANKSEKKTPCNHYQIHGTRMSLPESCPVWHFSISFDNWNSTPKLSTLHPISSSERLYNRGEAVFQLNQELWTGMLKPSPWLFWQEWMVTIPHTFQWVWWRKQDRVFHNTNFSYAERDFFTNKLKQAYPKIDTESITNAINFLERQKEANCPCSIHTQKRGYDWIVFNRLPDKLSSNTTTALCSDIEEEYEDESGAASENYSSADLTVGYNAIFNPKVQNSSNDFFLTSRDDMHIGNKKNDQARQNWKQIKNPTRNDVPFSAPRQKNTDEEENAEPTKDMLDESEQSVDSNKPSKFDPIVTVDNAKGKTYCYKYFRALQIWLEVTIDQWQWGIHWMHMPKS